ncbi:MAG TPA: amidohydrolase family protein, partial [Bryobacteraceae bacterium]|nr:amidohydrolase family protein [Bryobacteraceae bacterium]
MFIILALFVAGLGGAQGADMVVTNARIYTLDEHRPTATALAVRDGHIIYVGDDAGAPVAASMPHFDAHGAAIVPGFIDSHVHMQALGDELETFDLRDVKTVAEVAAVVRKEAAHHKPGEWIRGRGWDQTNWGGRFPSADDLSAGAPANPVVLSRVDGHAVWVNRQALSLAAVTAQTPDPPGGRILRTAAGEPTGVL